MPKPREIGRGERILPGVWRLRLPLPWPGVPHCNAWALAAGGGRTAYELARAVYGDQFTDVTASWLLSKTLCWLAHLERHGEVAHDNGSPETWAAAA